MSNIWVFVAVAAMALVGRADTTSYSTSFSFNHQGSVSSGPLSLLGYYTQTDTASSPTLTLARFNPALGRLTEAKITFTTTTSNFSLGSSGTLSLISGGEVKRKLEGTISVGTLTNTLSNEVITTGGNLVTSLSLGTIDIGGAPLNKSSSYTASNDLAQFTGQTPFNVTMASTDTMSVVTVLSVFNGAGMTGTGTYAGTANILYTYTPWQVSGYVYKDGNRSGYRDSGEGGTGVALYAKLVSDALPFGPAVAVGIVDPTTGAFTVSATWGSYRLIIDDNALLTDVVPWVPPAGWIPIEGATMTKSISITGDLPDQNFGLFAGSTIRGKVFQDSGTSSGTANDGVINGGEIGLAGVAVSVSTQGGTLLDSTVTGGDGAYVLYVADTVSTGTTLRVTETNPSDKLSTGASVGTSGGTYARATDTISFTFTKTMNYSGLNFGDVTLPRFSGNGEQSASPGSSVFFTHQFNATSTGKLNVSTSFTTTPTESGWTVIVYVDQNGNGQVDSGETALSGPLDLVEGQSVSLIAKVTVPNTSIAGRKTQLQLQASFGFTGANPTLSTTLVCADMIEVTAGNTPVLKILKSVDKGSARPGETLTYTLTFTNQGAAAVSGLTISDFTPTYTTFTSATTTSAPAGLTLATLDKPAANGTGAIRWTFTGKLNSGESGVLTFVVRVNL